MYVRRTEPPERWRRVPWAAGDGVDVLAADEALLDAVAAGEAPPTLRWYGFRRATLVLGYGQRPGPADAAACAARGVPVLRRRGGGTAVLAEPTLLCLSVALPPRHRLNDEDVTVAYHWLGETLAAALERLGAPARVVGIDEARTDARDARNADRALACYGSLSPYEVVVGPRKLVGLAQIRRRGATLFQAGIPLRPPALRIADLLDLPPARRDALSAALAARTIDLETACGRALAPETVAAAVERDVIARWRVIFPS